MNSKKQVLVIIVLGDLKRSPRMQLHARAAKGAFVTQLFGYHSIGNDQADQAVLGEDVVSLGRTPLRLKRRWTSLLWRIPRRILVEQFQLFSKFIEFSRCRVLLVQNPPAVPLIPILFVLRVLFRKRILVDWHNFGSDILALNLGPKHPFVAIYQFLERIVGALGHEHLCVSEALQRPLQRRIGISSPVVVYDLPRNLENDGSDKIAFQERLRSFEFDPQLEKEGAQLIDSEKTLIAVCPTSWTEDDAFDLLLDSVHQLDELISESNLNSIPAVQCLIIITGKGTRKEEFIDQIEKTHWKYSKITTTWLSIQDYSSLIKNADLGVSLHDSASGYDLPIKLADFQSVQTIPVLLDYGPVIRERMSPGEDGLTFKSSGDLANILFDGVQAKAIGKKPFSQIQDNLNQREDHSWEDQWSEKVAPIIQRLMQ